MVLHMILTIGVRSMTEMLCRMNALKEVKDLEEKTHAWILDIVADGKNLHNIARWIKRVLAEEIETEDSAGMGSKYDDGSNGEDMNISEDEEEEDEKDSGKKRNALSIESLT